MDAGGFENLHDDVVKSILIYVSPRDILNICRSRTYISRLCQDDNFWRWVGEINYPQVEPGSHQTWKQLVTFLITGENNQPDTGLRTAIMTNNASLVKYFLPKIIRLNFLGSSSYLNISDYLLPDIRLAIHQGHIHLVMTIFETLKTRMTNTDLKFSFYLEILNMALIAGSAELFFYVIDFFANYTNWHLRDIELNNFIPYAVRMKNYDVIDYLFSHGANNWNIGLMSAAAIGNRELVDYFLTRGELLDINRDIGYEDRKRHIDLNQAMIAALQEGHIELSDYFVSLGANNWLSALLTSITLGNKNLVEKYINLVCTDPTNHKQCVTIVIDSVVKTGNTDMINLVLSHGFGNYNMVILAAIENNRLDVAKEYISSGASNEAMIAAVKYRHPELVKYLVSIGADDFNAGMLMAVETNQLDLVDYFISLGANAWRAGLIAAIASKNPQLRNFFKSKLSSAS